MKYQDYLYRRLVLAMVMLFFPALAAQSLIKERFKKAKVGDFALYEKLNNLHLLSIHSILDNRVILEEISFAKNKSITNIREWIKSDKAHFSSHNMIELDLQKSRVLECYSFTQKRFLQITKSECFILNLLDLDFKVIPDDEKKRIGPTPLEDVIDRRKIWSPPYIIDTKRHKANFSAYFASWPKDKSPLANKRIETYFDQNHPFAYWIEVKDNSGIALRISCKDSGTALESRIKQMPRRRPRIISALKETKDQYRLRILCPPYYDEFKLYAYNIHSDFSTPYEIQFTSKYEDESDILNIILDKSKLKKTLELNQTYALEFHTLAPIHCRLESMDSFLLTDSND